MNYKWELNYAMMHQAIRNFLFKYNRKHRSYYSCSKRRFMRKRSVEMRCLWNLFVISSCVTSAFSRIIVKDPLHSGGKKVKGVVEGDIILPKFRNARRQSYYKWPNGTVPYVISSNFSENVYHTITSAMHEIEMNTKHGNTNCITFVERTTEADYLNIQIRSGCTSHIGRYGGAQLLSIGTGCDIKGAIMHELIHALGFWHEQSRYDRDRYINVHTSNIADDILSNFQKEDLHSMTFFGTPYDFGSIMHYGAYMFAANTSRPVLTPKLTNTAEQVKMGQLFAMSKLDVERIQKLYKCTVDTSHVNTFRNIIRCSFDTYPCNLKQDTQDDFDWIRHVSGTPTGGTRPVADFTNGVGSYIYAAVQAHHGLKARLLTPTFDRGQYCIHFGIYFVGPESGAFKILTAGPLITEHTLTTIVSTSQAKWREFMVDVIAPSAFIVSPELELQLSRFDFLTVFVLLLEDCSQRCTELCR